ncbi:arsenical efflux pump membrane protein ArsB [Massilia eurypsychrophila]|uniref:Arsenical pump membrane protein n=1 Tax=Massilia eurypsychrophila TaxID=1485217 RepID=A0A2G8TCN1_9BURK|nr:arsenic transporter [Massilia eurypsychrophila]PIL43790.1 arsenical efflux pump membrane protein ArsB [Massilia eurypsychrophila]
MLLAFLIFLVTLILVIWQPRGLGIGWSASAGALVALLAGVIHVADIPVVWHIVWNATGTFVAVIIISLLLDKAGFFEWAALHVARWGRGSGKRLFVLLVLLGASVAALFANDGAALILTPIVIAMLRALRFSAKATLAYVMAAGFIADTASLPLVVSNLVNIVSADYFNISFGRYAAVMVPVNLVSVAATLGMLMWFFRKDIPANYDVAQLRTPDEAIHDRATFVTGWWVLGLLLVGFFWLERLGVPISAVAAAGAALLLAVAARGHKIATREVLSNAPWQVVIFSLGMYLVVYGLRNAGMTDYLATVLNECARYGVWGAALGTGLITAILSSIMNNMPTVLIGALSIDATTSQGVVREAMVYANVIGSDLGPKITPIGSLATLLWLHVLESKDIKISWGYYFRVGIVLTLPVLVLTLAALALRLS